MKTTYAFLNQNGQIARLPDHNPARTDAKGLQERETESKTYQGIAHIFLLESSYVMKAFEGFKKDNF